MLLNVHKTDSEVLHHQAETWTCLKWADLIHYEAQVTRGHNVGWGLSQVVPRTRQYPGTIQAVQYKKEILTEPRKHPDPGQVHILWASIEGAEGMLTTLSIFILILPVSLFCNM